MRVLIKEPGKDPHTMVIQNNLHLLQQLVDGLIEVHTLADGLVMIVNEEGKLKNLPHNFTLYGENIVGPVVIVGVDGEDCCDCPIDIDTWKLFLKEWGNEV